MVKTKPQSATEDVEEYAVNDDKKTFRVLGGRLDGCEIIVPSILNDITIDGEKYCQMYKNIGTKEKPVLDVAFVLEGNKF